MFRKASSRSIFLSSPMSFSSIGFSSHGDAKDVLLIRFRRI